MRCFIRATIIALALACADRAVAATVLDYVSTSPTITIGDSIFPPTKASNSFGTAYPFKIRVRGCNGVAGVDVRFTGLYHSNPDDINIMLVSPAGKKTLLMQHCGGNFGISTPGITLNLSDGAGSALPDSGSISNFGTYRPAKYGTAITFPSPAPATTNVTLASLVSATDDPNGDWLLYVCDDANNGKNGSMSGWRVSITLPSAPANDAFASAQDISGALPISLPGTCFGATDEANEPTHLDYDTPDFSVWYKWTAPASGEVVAETSAVTFNTVLGIYTGTAVDALTEVAFNNEKPGNVAHESGLIFAAVAGTDYWIKVDGYDGYTVGTFTLGLHAPTSAPTIAATDSASGVVGIAFSHDIVALNYPSSYAATGLPPGLALDSKTGAISGTPTTAGTYPVSVQVANSIGSASQTLTLAIGAPPTITSPLYVSCTQGLPFSYTITATNSPTSFAIDSGTWDLLPAGITLNTATGVISGTTTDAIDHLDVDIVAINADGQDVQTLHLFITGPTAPVVNSPTIGRGKVGVRFFFAVAASNAPTSYDAVGLPPGLDIGDDSDWPNLITGKPTDAGTYSVAIEAENGDGTTIQYLTLIIDAVDPGAGGGGSTSNRKCGIGSLALIVPLALVGWRRRRRR